MSVNYEGGLSLGELIEILQAQPQDIVLPFGFGCPDSYRGYYDAIMFRPELNITIAQMLTWAKSANGAFYSGYKGGEYLMSLETEIYLARWGETGGPITKEVLKVMLTFAGEWMRDPELYHEGKHILKEGD